METHLFSVSFSFLIFTAGEHQTFMYIVHTFISNYLTSVILYYFTQF